MLEIFEILDRYELLFPGNEEIANLRRAYIDQDLSSIFKILPNTVTGELDDLRRAVLESNLHSIFRLIDDDDLRKLILENNEWKLWPILSRYTNTHFTDAFKNLLVNSISYDKDCFSRGQLKSKLWLVNELKKLNLDLGVIFLCAGWYATLSTMMFENNLSILKIRSFDIDPSCEPISKIFNKPWVIDDWKFQSSTVDIHDIDFNQFSYSITKANGNRLQLTDSPDTIINTSTEHIFNYTKWYNKIPAGKLLIVQGNNFKEISEHVNCSDNLEEFSQKNPMTTVLYEGELDLLKYKRFMKIGFK